MRLYALFDRNKKVLLILGLLLGCEIVSETVLVVIFVRELERELLFVLSFDP